MLKLKKKGDKSMTGWHIVSLIISLAFLEFGSYGIQQEIKKSNQNDFNFIGKDFGLQMLLLWGLNGLILGMEVLNPLILVLVLALIGFAFLFFKKKQMGVCFLYLTLFLFGLSTWSNLIAELENMELFLQMIREIQGPVFVFAFGFLLSLIVPFQIGSLGILLVLVHTGLFSYAYVIPAFLGQMFATGIQPLFCKYQKIIRQSGLLFSGSIAIVAFLFSLFQADILESTARLTGVSLFYTILSAICLWISVYVAKKINQNSQDQIKKTWNNETDVSKLVKEIGEVVVQIMDKSLQCLFWYELDEVKKIYEMKEKVLLNIQWLYDNEKKIGPELKNSLLKRIVSYENMLKYDEKILEWAGEMKKIKNRPSQAAEKELKTLTKAIHEIVVTSVKESTAEKVEPLKDIIAILVEQSKKNHQTRLERKECNEEFGQLWLDLLSDLEKISQACPVLQSIPDHRYREYYEDYVDLYL